MSSLWAHERERQTGRHRERGRGRESARACVRAAFGALGICARRNTARAPRGAGIRESLLGTCSLLMVARAHTHSACTRTDDTRGSSLAHRLTDVALALHAIGCDSCPCPRKPMLSQYLVLLHSPDTCSSSSCCFDAMRMRVLAACAAPHSLQDWLLQLC